MQPHSSYFTLANMSSLGYFNGLANTQYPADSFITHCLVSCFLLLCALPLITYFKREIQRTFVYIENIMKYTYIYITCILLPHEKFITEVRKQLIQPPFMEQITSFQDSQQDFQVFIKFTYIPNVSIERTYSPLFIYNDQAFTEFVNREERCLKFVNQDLTFLQASYIPSTFSNVSHVPTELKEPTCLRLPTHISTEDNNTLHTQIVEAALGFTLEEKCCAQNEPKLTVQQLLEIESCKDYIKTLLQTLDGIYVNQPKDSYPLPRR